MKRTIVPLFIALAAAVGICLGYVIGIDDQFKRDAAFQGFVLTEFHAALVDEDDAYEEVVPLLLEQADTLDRIADMSSNVVSPELLDFLGGKVRMRIDKMRRHTDDYLKTNGVRSELAQSN